MRQCKDKEIEHAQFLQPLQKKLGQRKIEPRLARLAMYFLHQESLQYRGMETNQAWITQLIHKQLAYRKNKNALKL